MNLKTTSLAPWLLLALVGCTEDTSRLDASTTPPQEAGVRPDAVSVPQDAMTPVADSGAPSADANAPDALEPGPDAMGEPDAAAAADAADVADAAGADSGAPPACPMAAQSVATLQDLLQLVPAAYGNARYFSQRTLSGDIRTTSRVVVSRGDFAHPSDCVGPCAQQPVLVNVRGNISGAGTGPRGEVVLSANTVFRMRFAVVFLPPGGEFATVTFEPACVTACEPDERRCAEDLACYDEGLDYCRDCDHDTPQRCGCAGLQEGESCFFILGDIAFSGQCENGECKSN